ncbi:MAG: hypothetical protein ACPGVD_05620 [Flavobacteriales bacterium]
MKNVFQFSLTKILISIATGLLLLVVIQNCKKNSEETECNTPSEPFNHQVTFNYEYDISGMNDTLKDNVLTADIVLFHSDQLAMTWNTLKAEFLRADNAFRTVGVQLNLKKAVNVTFPDEWNNQLAYNLLAVPDSGINPAFYDMYNTTKPTPTDTIKMAIEDFIIDEKNKSRTIFVLPLKGVSIIFAQKNTDGTWKISNPVATGALSFPSYILHDRIQKDYRGVITMEQSSGVTLAHELGHKLINVSHEGLGISPAFSGSSIPGLMGYGGSTTIYGRQSGRWHQERLLLSPFLYKMNRGAKTYNPDYNRNGSYNDGIYGTFVMP